MAFEEICFANNLRKIRMERGIKMTEVARKTGLSLSAMSKIEKGYRRINQKVMLKLCGVLNCKVSDLFIKENDSDAIKHWQTEISRRFKENESSGLKIFGAGLRHIRKSIGKTIVQAAKEAKMTLSVYHHIEVGQRDVYEDEIKNLANMTGRTPEALVKEIYQLHEQGKLKKATDATETDAPKSITMPGGNLGMGGINIAGVLYGAKMYELTRNRMIPIFGTPSNDGIAFKKSDEKMIIAPSSLEGQQDIYAIIPNSRRMNNVLPPRSYALVNPTSAVQAGDLAILLSKNFDDIKESDKVTGQIVIVREDPDSGKLSGHLYNPDEKIAIGPNHKGKLHKVIQVIIE
ncbi:MAG: transcriptional regulator [Alphaproteobacteria bacterium]|nr:transcriptional regulator [Alphaproteobacteria bacterium]